MEVPSGHLTDRRTATPSYKETRKHLKMGYRSPEGRMWGNEGRTDRWTHSVIRGFILKINPDRYWSRHKRAHKGAHTRAHTHPHACIGKQDENHFDTRVRSHSVKWKNKDIQKTAAFYVKKTQIIYYKDSICSTLIWLGMTCPRWSYFYLEFRQGKVAWAAWNKSWGL